MGKKTQDRRRSRQSGKIPSTCRRVSIFFLHEIDRIASLQPSRPEQNAELVLVLDQGREGRTDDNADDNIQNLHIDDKLITCLKMKTQDG
jgi:hypothetical protein